MKLEYHTPVLVKETLKFLNPKSGKIYIDATIGGSGHAQAILENLAGAGLLIGIDRDEEAIEVSRERLAKFEKSATLIHENFINIKEILKKLNIEKVDGILFDLGVSSHQIDTPGRGFSLRTSGPLDMRMDKDQSLTAKEIVNSYPLDNLAKIIRDYGEERCAKRIARAIVEARKAKPISTTLELAEVIKRALGRIPPKRSLDSITRTFQALRIAVNAELNNLAVALRNSIDVLGKNGRIVVISYHSLEDRIVKHIFREEATDCICPPRTPVCICGHKKRIRILTKKPVTPTKSEIHSNPRGRSAKLRAMERILR